MATFRSDNGWYLVECPDNKEEGIRDFVQFVDTKLVPVMEKLLPPLEPLLHPFKVIFTNKGKDPNYDGPSYWGKGLIYLPDDIDYSCDQHRYGSLIHETSHGFIDNYIHRSHGNNLYPGEALVIMLQVATISKVNVTLADEYKNGTGSSESIHLWLKKLGQIFDEAGFDPLREIFQAMANSEDPVFVSRTTYIEEVNQLWKQKGYGCRLCVQEDERAKLIENLVCG